jgi:hypothetical protein
MRRIPVLFGAVALILGPTLLTGQATDHGRAAEEAEQARRPREDFQVAAVGPDEDGELETVLRRQSDLLKQVEPWLLQNGVTPEMRQSIKNYFQGEHLQLAQTLFKQFDHRGGGMLSADDVSETLRREIAHWDLDHNGFIDYEEYKAYFLARVNWLAAKLKLRLELPGNMKRAPAKPTDEPEEPPLDPSAMPKLPDGLPEWYRRVDKEHDGQVTLSQWREAGLPPLDFRRLDRNDDGFVTVDEVLRHLKRVQEGKEEPVLQPPQMRGGRRRRR